MKNNILFIYLLLLTSSFISQIQIGQNIQGEPPYGLGYSVSMPDKYTIAGGAPYDYVNVDNIGKVSVYNYDGTNWLQKGSDIVGEALQDRSGYTICMPDVNTIAIGAPNNYQNGPDAGHVRVFKWNGNNWVQKGLDIDGQQIQEYLGMAVSMPDSNTIAIGAPWNDENGEKSGRVCIYSWDGSSWIQKGTNLEGEAIEDRFGTSVSMPDANTIAIGGYLNDGNGENAGQTRIYYWNGTSWVQKGSDIDGEAAFDLSSSSISMPDANTVAIGAPFNDGNGDASGHVRVFSWIDNNWIQKGGDIDGEEAFDWFGWSISMPNNNTLAIGAPIDEDIVTTKRGYVKVYDWNGVAWVQNGINIIGDNAYDSYGWAVSMSDFNTVGISAPVNGVAGQLKVYEFSSTASIPSISKNMISINPNPTSSNITINFQTPQFNEKVSIYSVSGQKLVEKEVHGNSISICVSNFSNGIYFIEVNGFREKFVVE